jgi:hypothetical protein
MATVTGCGQGLADRVAGSVNEAAHGIGESVHEHQDEINEAAKEVACHALEAYSRAPSQSLAQLIDSQAQRPDQQVLGGETLAQSDPGAAARLQTATNDVETSQQASDVMDKLSC